MGFFSSSSKKKRLRPGRFDPARGQWDYAEHAAGSVPAHDVSCATFNVWFGEKHFEERCLALLRILERRRPDVIALQEVTIPFLAALRSSAWVRRDYLISDYMGSTITSASYGVVLLTRLPVESMELHELPSRMGRKLLVAHLTVNDTRLAVGTVHLESLDSAEYRGRQLAQIFKTLKGERDVLLMGDFNFCSTWPEEQARLDPQYEDVWPALHDGDPGFTENTDVNLMLGAMSDRDKKVRYDRLLVRSGKPGWAAASIELLGTEPISSTEPDIFPSDHFGLFAHLHWQD